ncbi:hypothetical protein BH24GEM3_BH24GEM3_14570 [soil metagenome]
MADNVRLIDPDILKPNPENPRLIFRQEELDALQESIAQQGILVPLTVFQDGKQYFLLDGERRWRCAIKLGLLRVPVIVQPKPDRLQNLMMMFAIHNARRDWDPLPTALKLQQLELEFKRRQERTPTETELAGLASLTRGEVRRLKKLLGLPKEYRKELLDELEKPRTEQLITVDHVLEATRGAEALTKRGIIAPEEEEELRRAVIDKFRTKVIRNTVAPRMLARIGRAVERGEITKEVARQAARKIIEDPKYSIEDAFRASGEEVDFEHGVDQLTSRLRSRLEEHSARGYDVSDKLRSSLMQLSDLLDRILHA